MGPVASRILRKLLHVLIDCTPCLHQTHMLLLLLFSLPTLFLLARNVVKNPVGILSGLGSPYMHTRC